MNSNNLSSALTGLKGCGADEAFDEFYLIISEALVENRKTYTEQLLSKALREGTEQFQEMRKKFLDYVEGIRKFELFIRDEDDLGPDEYFFGKLLYAHDDSCGYLAKQAFEFGVAYGKTSVT